MKTCSARIAAVAAVVFACANFADATTISYFSFNSLVASTNYSSVNADAGYIGNLTSNTTFTDFAGTTDNRVGSTLAGQALAFTSNANNNNYITFNILSGISTASNLIFSYSTQSSGSTGFTTQTLSYAVNGSTTFATISPTVSPPTSFATQSFALSGLAGVSGADSLNVRITFTGASGGSGNNRIDNARLDGDVPAAVPLPPAAIAGGALLGIVGLLKRRRPGVVA